MKTRTGVLALALVLAGAPVAAVAEEVPLPALYKALAEKNHYAVVEGVQEAQADVKCNIMEQLVAAFPDAAGKPITIQFKWSRPDPNAAPTKQMIITGVPETLTDLKARLTTLFNTVQDFVIPDPPYWTIAQYDAKAMNEAGKITVTGTPKNPADPIKSLNVDIDGATYQVGKMEMDLGQAKVAVETTYEDAGGKWVTKTMTINHPQYKRTVSYEYSQPSDNWMPSKISIETLGADGQSLEPTYVYEFSGWKVTTAPAAPSSPAPTPSGT